MKFRLEVLNEELSMLCGKVLPNQSIKNNYQSSSNNIINNNNKSKPNYGFSSNFNGNHSSSNRNSNSV